MIDMVQTLAYPAGGHRLTGSSRSHALIRPVLYWPYFRLALFQLVLSRLALFRLALSVVPIRGRPGRLSSVGMTRVVGALVRATHPLPTMAVTVSAAALAVATGRDGPGVAAVAVTILASQLAVGWHNDWLDVERDAAAYRRDKPLARGELSPRVAGWAAVVAAGATVPLALLSGVSAALVAAIGLGSALAYNWPFKFTLASPLPYIVSFGALPAFVVLGRSDGEAPPWWLLAAGAALGAGAHFANVLPDIDDDLRHGVRGLPQRLGRPVSTAIAAALVMTVTLLLTFGPTGPPPVLSVVGLGVAVVVLAVGGYRQWREPRSRGAFRAVLLVAMIDVALLLVAGSFV
jgi:4-hydroxybenzoate polyprenyltransferase